jgi:hypothetical protein
MAKKSIKKHSTLDSSAALSGGIAHDYNNLLTAIIGNITLDRLGFQIICVNISLTPHSSPKKIKFMTLEVEDFAGLETRGKEPRNG